ncbi:hypothetical protein [Natronomonas marina]|uniref:hypothetical protein n=1 Tax=Natronomonas marina TaxID=2961939 RepID=UPI003D9C8880
MEKGDTRLEIVEDLLDSAMEMVSVDRVLMDREFDSQHVLKAIAGRGLTYAVPKRMQTREKAPQDEMELQDSEGAVSY